LEICDTADLEVCATRIHDSSENSPARQRWVLNTKKMMKSI